MVSLVQLWLPVLMSAVAVFIASSIVHMLLKFWHMPDYHGFSNEDEVGAAMRKDNPAPGMYVLPYCRMQDMNKPESIEKFKAGPVGFVILRPDGMPNMGKNLLLWFVFCLVVSLFCAFVAIGALDAGANSHRVFHTTALVALMAYAAGTFPMGIWWGQPWRAVIKDAVDGLIYALLTGAIFMWLWPAAH
ncbi:MAG: hypothetical protein WBV39_09990 [Rudaea sp.]